MTILDLSVGPELAHLATDSGMFVYPSGTMGDARAHDDPAALARIMAERRARPHAPPLRRLMDTQKFVVGRGARVVAAGSGYAEPLVDWFNVVRDLPSPTFDEVSALAPRRLAEIAVGLPAAVPFVAIAVGWSDARDRVCAELYGRDDGFCPVEIESYAMFPWPDEAAPDFAPLRGALSRPARELADPVGTHVALARHQAAAYRRGAYGPGAAGGRLWLCTVTRHGVRSEVVADLDEGAHAEGPAAVAA